MTKVMVVDDSATMTKLLKTKLEGDYEIVTAPGGHRAVGAQPRSPLFPVGDVLHGLCFHGVLRVAAGVPGPLDRRPLREGRE